MTGLPNRWLAYWPRGCCKLCFHLNSRKHPTVDFYSPYSSESSPETHVFSHSSVLLVDHLHLKHRQSAKLRVLRPSKKPPSPCLTSHDQHLPTHKSKQCHFA